MQKFELVILNEKVKQYKMLALLIILINVLFFIWMAISSPEYRSRSLSTIVLILVAFLIQYFTRKKKEPFIATGTAVFFIILFYVETDHWLIVAIIALLAILYDISKRKLLVTVNPNHIMYPSFPKRKISWEELNNMILKDGLLTIDFKNNKLAQMKVINGENDYDIDEKEFNEFCKMQLALKNTLPEPNH